MRRGSIGIWRPTLGTIAGTIWRCPRPAVPVRRKVGWKMNSRTIGWRTLSPCDSREQPLMFAYSCLVRVGRLWGVMPHAGAEQETMVKRTLRYAIAVWYTVLFAFALWGLAAGGRTAFSWPWICGLLLCLAFTLVHAFYWTDLRMRAPLMPFLAIAAAAGAGRSVSRGE